MKWSISRASSIDGYVLGYSKLNRDYIFNNSVKHKNLTTYEFKLIL